MNPTVRGFALALVFTRLASCGLAERERVAVDAGVDAAPASGPEVTYQRDLRPLIEASCLSCHGAGGAASLELHQPEAVERLAERIVEVVVARTMPPYPADPACRPLRDVRALSADTIALFERWRTLGFPLGAPHEYTPPAAATDPQTVAPALPADLELAPERAYTPRANSEEYRCFLLGRVDGERYLRAIAILPERPEQVHHAQLHALTDAQLPAVFAQDDADAELGYACETGTGVGSRLLHSYRPGSGTVSFQPGDAALLERGSTLLLQVHYHTHALAPQTIPEADTPRVRLWTLPPGELPRRVMIRTGATASVNIPSGAAQVLARSDLPLFMLSSFGSLHGFGGTFVAGEIVGITPHAHHLATRLEARFTAGERGPSCLLDVPRWSFDWQLDYMLSEGVPYGPDDRLEIRCEYDNRPEHQPLQHGVRTAPRDVTWGERSSDEMCLFYLWLRFEREAYLQGRAAGTLP